MPMDVICLLKFSVFFEILSRTGLVIAFIIAQDFNDIMCIYDEDSDEFLRVES